VRKRRRLEGVLLAGLAAGLLLRFAPPPAFGAASQPEDRDTLDNFRDEKITVEGTRLEPKGDVTVMTVVHGGSGDTNVDYRMRKLPEGWRGIDVIVEGVSLVQNFRTQAQEILSSQSPDTLIQRLRDKQVQDLVPKGKG